MTEIELKIEDAAKAIATSHWNSNVTPITLKEQVEEKGLDFDQYFSGVIDFYRACAEKSLQAAQLPELLNENTKLQTKLTEQDKLIEVMGEAIHANWEALECYGAQAAKLPEQKEQLKADIKVCAEALAQYQSYKAGRE